MSETDYSFSLGKPLTFEERKFIQDCMGRNIDKQTALKLVYYQQLGVINLPTFVVE